VALGAALISVNVALGWSSAYIVRLQIWC